jgi:dTDP-4-dehydrorhamnose reductase
MQIIILGANGMLGSMMRYVGHKQNLNILPLGRAQFDALCEDTKSLMRFLTKDCCVVNCIGAIPQKKYEDCQFTRLNTEFPIELASLCATHKVPLVHISTNCVFSGTSPMCCESDTPDATDMYGLSKSRGEPSNCVVLRCSIIGPEINSAFGLFEWFLNSQNTVKGFTDHYWNGLTTLELASFVYSIIKERSFYSRLQHCYSETVVSKNDLLHNISNLFSKKISITPVSNGTKYYTLSSNYSGSSKHIYEQLKELWDVLHEYRAFAITI